MADTYQSVYLGTQIDDAVGRIVNGEIDRSVARAESAASNANLYSESSLKSSQNSAAKAQESLKYSQDSLKFSQDSAKKAEESSQFAQNSAAKATESSRFAQNSADSSIASKSWAVGSTGTRPGENRNNSQYYANVAQAEADRATIPVVDGGYNLILRDRVTSKRYALAVDNGTVVLVEVTEAVEDMEGGLYNVVLQDRVTAEKYAVILENKILVLLGMNQASNVTRKLALVDASGNNTYTMAVENARLYLEEVL